MITKQDLEVKKEFINSKLLDCQILLYYKLHGTWVSVVREYKADDGNVYEEDIFGDKKAVVYTFLCGMMAAMSTGHLPGR